MAAEAAAAGRDDSEFVRFVRDHTSALHRTAFLLTGNRHDAEELLQATLTHLYPRWDRVSAAEAPLAYVRRALANRFVSDRRSPAARAESFWELPDGWDGVDIGERVAVASTVWQLLGTLPERQRVAVVMRYVDDLPDADVAATLGCRQVTVRSLVSRGLASLRSAYLASTASAEGTL